AHDIKQPLQAIGTYTGALRRQFGDSIESSKNFLDICNRISSQITAASDLLEEKRKFIGRCAHHYETVHINQTVERVLKLTQARLVATDTHVLKYLANDLNPVYGVAIQLEQMLTNIVVNAIEAMSGCSTRQLTITS